MEEKNNKDSNTSQKEPEPSETSNPMVITSTSPSVIPTYVERNRVANGRKYLNVKNTDCVLPNDEQELNNLQLQHALLKHAWNGNFSSSIHEALKVGGLKVLDVGCGSGTWLFDMCMNYPLCDFIGLDISPVSPSPDSMPQNSNNVTFIQSDALDGLPFKDNTFDFVHQRSWMNVLTMKQWEPAIQELARVCKVGGWLELLETEIVYYNEGINTRNLRASFLAYFYSKDLFIDVCRHLPHFLKSSGSFNEINKEECDIPLGEWAGKFGQLGMKLTYEGYKDIYPELQSIMEVSEEEYNEVLNRFTNEANEYKTFYKTFRFFCCKVR